MTEFEVEVNAALLPDTGSNATKDPIISKDVRKVKIVKIVKIVRKVTAPSKSPRINQKIYLTDIQHITIFALARWHQFSLTAQVKIFYIPGNHQVIFFQVAR